MVTTGSQDMQSFRTVTPHAGQQDANDLSGPESPGAREKNIDRGTGAAISRIAARVNKMGGAGELKMSVLTSQQYTAWNGLVSCAGHSHVQRALLIQPIGEAVREMCVYVLHDHHRRLEIRGQMGQHFSQSRRAACRGADADQKAMVAGGQALPSLSTSGRQIRAPATDQPANSLNLS